MLGLDEEQKDALDAPISLEEIHKATANFRCNSSLGPDSLTSEFYKKFKKSLAVYLHELFLSLLEQERHLHLGN